MNIIITGGAGFVGSNLADSLLQQGDAVFVIDNLVTGRKENVNPKVKLFSQNSIADEKKCEEMFSIANPDIVIHAAATGTDPNAWELDTMSNVLGTINIIKYSKKYRIRRLIYFQTSLCYGTPIEQPITLSHPLSPTNSYSITKTAAEQFIKMSGLDFISFRLANCYGPRNLAGAIPAFYRRLSKGLKCTIYDTRRDFVYIDDLVKIVLMAINGKGKCGCYHISTGKDFSINDVFHKIRKAMISEKISNDFQYAMEPKIEEDVYSILLDPSKTLEDFGCSPGISLDFGLPEAVKWYKINGIERAYTHLPIQDKF